jgi:hypothetical protein
LAVDVEIAERDHVASEIIRVISVISEPFRDPRQLRRALLCLAPDDGQRYEREAVVAGAEDDAVRRAYELALHDRIGGVQILVRDHDLANQLTGEPHEGQTMNARPTPTNTTANASQNLTSQTIVCCQKRLLRSADLPVHPGGGFSTGHRAHCGIRFDGR